jgi:hypothetical protein
MWNKFTIKTEIKKQNFHQYLIKLVKRPVYYLDAI